MVFFHVMGESIIVIMHFILNDKKSKYYSIKNTKIRKKKDNKWLCFQDGKKKKKDERINKEK